MAADLQPVVAVPEWFAWWIVDADSQRSRSSRTFSASTAATYCPEKNDAMLQVDTRQAAVQFDRRAETSRLRSGIYGRWWPRATWDRVTGVHRPLTATAVVLRDRAASAAEADAESDEEIIVALNMCILFAAEQEALLTEVRRRTGVGGQLMCHYSHTHSSPPVEARPGGPPWLAT